MVVTKEKAIVRVRYVSIQNRNGAIFTGERITNTGEIIDPNKTLTVRLHEKAVGVKVAPGQWWEVQGQVEPRTFINRGGFQMTVDQMDVAAGDASMTRPSGFHVVDYIAKNAAYKGIGEVTAELLWETFGEVLFDVLDEGDTTALTDVIGPQRASALVQGWCEEGLSDTIQWLHSHEIGHTIGRRILDSFGKDAREKINENPYRLLSFAAGWAEVDKLAREQLGIESDDERRLMAGIEETVYRRFSQGHTYAPRSDLVAGLRTILKGERHERDLIEKAISASEATGRLLFDSEGNAYSLGASILENKVVDLIKERLGRNSGAPCDVNRIITAYEDSKGYDIRLNQEQRDAVHMIANNDFAIVTGGAGCGKTTVLECVYQVLEDQGYSIVQLALAGKAVKRMMEATGRPAMTLASFIKKMNDAEAHGQSSTDRLALVIDEASMVDLISFSAAMRFVGENTKIVLIGDPHQLPPVGPGLILHCLTDIPLVPHVELKRALRFGSKIAGVANAIKDGRFPELIEFDDEIRFIDCDKQNMAQLAAELYLERPHDSVVLCATREVAKGVNAIVQESRKTGRKALKQWNMEHDTWAWLGFYEGDQIICTRNHWDLGVQNGSIGQLVEVADALEPDAPDVDERPALGRIVWDDGIITVLNEDLLDSLELGYAITVHKGQGSQWPRMVVCLPPSRMIDRSLVYTGITRAQREVVVLGDHDVICGAVQLKKTADRRLVALDKRLVSRLSCPSKTSL